MTNNTDIFSDFARCKSQGALSIYKITIGGSGARGRCKINRSDATVSPITRHNEVGYSCLFSKCQVSNA